MKQLSFDEFLKILEIYLKDVGDLMPVYSLDYIKQVKVEVASVFYAFQEGKRGSISLE